MAEEQKKRKFTNKYNAHKAIVNAVEIDDHVVNGDISVTQLMGPPQARYLKIKHKGDPRIQSDVRDQFWMLFGTIVHEILERGNVTYRDYWTFKKAYIVIKRHAQTEKDKKAAEYVKKMGERVLGHKIDKDLYLERTLSLTYRGWVISGTQDIYHAGKGILEDWKTCSANSVTYYENEKRDWEIQQNIYAYMLRRQGYPVKKIRIQAIYRDWSKMKVFTVTHKSYPKQPWGTHELPIWSDEKVEAYLDIRIDDHRNAMMGDVRECSAKERWSKKDEFAVMESGNTKRSIRNFGTRKEAEDYIEEFGFRLMKPWIEDRKSFDLKCEHFCNVKHVCDQYAGRKGTTSNKRQRKSARPAIDAHLSEEARQDKKEMTARTFDADTFLKQTKYEGIKDFRQTNPHLYEEEKDDKRYKIEEEDKGGELDNFGRIKPTEENTK